MHWNYRKLLLGQQNAKGKRELFSVSNLQAVVLFPHLFFHKASSVRECFPFGFKILFVWERRWGKYRVMDSSSCFCPCSSGLIRLDVSSCSYCSLDTRGSQKVSYNAFDLPQCCAQRTLHEEEQTLWQCHISVFLCVAMMGCRQSNVICHFSLLFPVEWCLHCAVVKGVKARKAGKNLLWWCTSGLSISFSLSCSNVFNH